MRKSLLAVAVAVLLLSQPHPAIADCSNPAGVEAQTLYNADQNVPQICTGTDWVALGTLNPSAGGSGCMNPNGTEGAIIYNNDIHVPQYCDGDNWIQMIGYAGGFLTFTDVTGQPTSAQVTSNILEVRFGGGISITGDGSAEYRICADAGCSSETQAWGSTAATITNGQFLQLRMTSSAFGGATSSASITVGSGSVQWQVTTQGGPCPGTVGPGDQGCAMADGSIYIGQLSGTDIYATSIAYESSGSWNDGTTNYATTGFASPTDGTGNTAGLVAATGNSDYPYQAAAYCDALTAHSHSDWYLPAKDELDLFWNSGTPVASVDTSGNWYWSSTEVDLDDAWLQRFNDGTQSNVVGVVKSSSEPVRCVRR